MTKKTDEQPVRIQDPLLGARFWHKQNGDVDRIEIYVDDGMFPASYDVVFTATPKKLLAMRDELIRLRKEDKRLRVIVKSVADAFEPEMDRELAYDERNAVRLCRKDVKDKT